jgi:hypothetical protein
MPSLGILEIAIGLVFIYLLLSLICSAAREGLEALLKWRAIDLERGILEMFGGVTTGAGLCKLLYEHPLINGLFRGEYQYKKGRLWSDLPSYIPATNFAQALIAVLMEAPAAGAALGTAPAQQSAGAHPGAAAQEAALARQAALAQQAAGAQPGAAAEQLTAVAASIHAVQLRALRAAISAIQDNDPLKNALLRLVDAAGNDMDRARANIEGWFNSTMDRVSGWYKRWSQGLIFVLGLLLVAALNVDTIDIGHGLARDPSLRQTLIAASQEVMKAQPNEAKDEARQRLQNEYDKLQKLGLPIGWDWDDTVRWPGRDPWRWLMKVIGLLITALAISLGAPFWFDVLNKFMIARSSVKPQEKTPRALSGG